MIIHLLFCFLGLKLPGHSKDVPQAVAADDFLQRFPHLLTPESVNERVDD